MKNHTATLISYILSLTELVLILLVLYNLLITNSFLQTSPDSESLRLLSEVIPNAGDLSELISIINASRILVLTKPKSELNLDHNKSLTIFIYNESKLEDYLRTIKDESIDILFSDIKFHTNSFVEKIKIGGLYIKPRSNSSITNIDNFYLINNPHISNYSFYFKKFYFDKSFYN